MGALFVYILKAAVCLSVFYLFYRLLLSRETFHRFNRIAVLGILVISLLIPFCEVKVTEQTEMHQTVLSLEQLLLLADMTDEAPVVEVQNEKVVWVHIVLTIYLAGILFFTCRNLYALIRLGLFLKSGKREQLDNKITLIIHDNDDLAPFSWMKYIVISHKDLEENGREILIHELAHIRKRHSIDLLIADICIFFQWFNPAAWLLKQELQTIHEYEADETVIKEGVDAKQYQLLLIKKAVGTRLYSMANSFNHSKLKKRITMMLKEKSSPWARLKYLYVLPLAAIAVTAFARPEVSNELKEISKVKVNDLTEIVEVNEVENQVALSAREPEPVIIRSRETVEKPELQSPIKQHGVKNGKEPLFIIDGKETTGAVLQSISPDHISSIDVLKDVKAVELFGEKATNGVVIVTLLSEKEREELAKKPKKNVVEIAKDHISSETLILFDGKEVSNIDNINPEDVGMIRVYNPKNKDDKEAAPLFEKYGNKAKGGIVSISSKKPGETAGLYVAGVGARAQIINVQGQVNDSEGKPVAGAVIKIAGSNVGTVSDMEGKFSLEARESDYISVLFIGMKKAVTKVSPKLTVTLEKGE